MQKHPKVIRVGGRKFASGKYARSICPICGLEYPYLSMLRDWRGVWVCPECNDAPPSPIRMYTDAQGLKRPQPPRETFDNPEQLPDILYGEIP